MTDEYYKRFGIYTSEEDKLGDFWKNHVSSDYKRKREEAAKKKAARDAEIAEMMSKSGFDLNK